MAYAESTSVSAERSRAEIERILKRYGAEEFAYATRRDMAVIQFTADGRSIRFTVPLPDPVDRSFSTTPTGQRRTEKQTRERYEQAVRQRWRALTLIVKSKLEAVESGIVTFEQEFFAHILLPGGSTVYEQAAGSVEQAYVSGAVPTSLLQIEAPRN